MSDDEADGRSPRRPPLSPLALSEGAIVAKRYELGVLISAGGQGAVYEAIDRHSGRTRAVKVLLAHHLRDPKVVERFEREAQLTAKIESEHLVEVLDAGVDERTAVPFIVMERLRGEDLGRHLERRGPLPPDEVVVLLRQAAIAIDKAHEHGILHRDLKPENLFVSRRDDGTPRVRVLDFGIAKILDGTSAPNTQVIGTPMYMAPEQLRAEARLAPAVDVFALGQIAFALLVGKPYWHEESVLPVYAFLAQLLQGPRDGVRDRAARLGVAVTAGFEAWMGRACAEAPGQRFSAATAAIDALEVALRGEDDVLDLGDDATQLAPAARTSALSLEPGGPTAATGPLPSLFDELASSRAPARRLIAAPGSTLMTPGATSAPRTTTTGGIASAPLPLVPMRGVGGRATWALVAPVALAALALAVRHTSTFGTSAPGARGSSAAVSLATPEIVPIRTASAVAPAPPAIEARPEPTSARSARPDAAARPGATARRGSATPTAATSAPVFPLPAAPTLSSAAPKHTIE